MLTINVIGTPAPQGSKKGFYNKGLGRVQMVESSKKVKPWRQDVKAATLDVIANVVDLNGSPWDIPTEPVELSVTFHIARPAYHFGTGRNAGVLKATAPFYVDKKPDLDKLLRSTMDGLKEAGAYRDDSQVVRILDAVKVYATGRTPGADIRLHFITETTPPRLTTSTGEERTVGPEQGEGQDRPPVNYDPNLCRVCGAKSEGQRITLLEVGGFACYDPCWLAALDAATLADTTDGSLF